MKNTFAVGCSTLGGGKFVQLAMLKLSERLFVECFSWKICWEAEVVSKLFSFFFPFMNLCQAVFPQGWELSYLL